MANGEIRSGGATALPWMITALAVCVAAGAIGVAARNNRHPGNVRTPPQSSTVEQAASGAESRSVQQRPAAAESPPENPDPFADLNVDFHANYRRVKDQALQDAAAVVVVQSDNLVLLIRGARVSERFTPPIYHTLKAVAHLPLGLYATLSDLAGKPLDDGATERLLQTRRAIRSVTADIDGRGLTDEQVERQFKICDASER